MGFDRGSRKAFDTVVREAKVAGSATFRGEQREREGRGLHPLVDPKGGGVIRRSLTWYEPRKDGKVYLFRGIAMPEETLGDITGSMGKNIQIMLNSLAESYDLHSNGKTPIMRKYDMQTATSAFGDVVDRYVLQRSEFEFDERIAEQMTHMFVERDSGGDATEDPHYGIAAAAYLTDASLYAYGLRSYHFTISDAPTRTRLDKATMVRIFGDEVWDKLAENGKKYGFSVDAKHLPELPEIVPDLLKRAHAFFFQVGNYAETRKMWTRFYGEERALFLPETRLLPHMKAAVMGLTEGVLDLQTLEEYLRGTGLKKMEAVSIVEAVSGIPIGAQAELPNFDKLPKKGDVFEKKGDLWPISADASSDVDSDEEESSADEPGGMWS